MKLVASASPALRGQTTLPGDKSLSHRAALFASLADGRSHIHNFLRAGVTDVMLRSLSMLGVPFTHNGGELTVEGRGLHGFQSPSVDLNCGNSATTIRLLAGALAASGAAAVLDGSSGLRTRPMNRIVHPLQKMDVPIHAAGNGYAPLCLDSRSETQPLRAMDYALPVASAQVKSCLLLAALSADGVTTLREPGSSRDHTERILANMGVTVASHRNGLDYITILTPPARLTPLDFTIPGDLSSAAFLLVAALIVPGSEITVLGVGLNPTRTGLLDSLISMGADLQVTIKGEQCGEPFGDVTARHHLLQGIHIGGDLVVRMIDEFPILAVAAAYARGITLVENAEELRYKESDRIAALCAELRLLGVDASETPDGFIVNGGKPVRGGVVDAHGDHRLAMSLTVAGLAAQEAVIVTKAEIMHESFPHFAEMLAGFGAKLEMSA